MLQLPKFKNDQEAADWFDAHDTSEHMGDLEPIPEPPAVVRTQFPVKPVDLRMRTDFLDAIQKVAERQGCVRGG